MTTQQLRPVVHIVRRLGRSGGMERYVWELIHGLTEAGLQVAVICEVLETTPDPAIQVYQVQVGQRPKRWQQMLSFRHQVSELLASDPIFADAIIHSHERSLRHHVTTFHGPLILSSMVDRIFAGISRRLQAWREMECTEVMSAGVGYVLPVSKWSKKQLRQRYPERDSSQFIVAWPGVHGFVAERSYTPGKDTGRTHRFVFVGKEWRRKGLKRASQIVHTYREMFQVDASLDIYGTQSSDLPISIRKCPWVFIHGWKASVPYEQYDALIHPARQEPFGMIVAEARQVGLPVLCSDQVGAIGLEFEGVVNCPLAKSARHWATELWHLRHSERARQPEVKWTWRDLVDLHINSVYRNYSTPT